VREYRRKKRKKDFMSPRKTQENPLGLPPYQGCAVTDVGVTIGNAGGGLHDPLEIDEIMKEKIANIQIGDTVYFLIRADCNATGYKPVKGAEDRIRYLPGFHATDTTIIDSAWAVDAINEQRDRVTLLREQAEGTQRLPFTEDETEAAAAATLALVGNGDEAHASA
jgi:hypothetical protein